MDDQKQKFKERLLGMTREELVQLAQDGRFKEWKRQMAHDLLQKQDPHFIKVDVLNNSFPNLVGTKSVSIDDGVSLQNVELTDEALEETAAIIREKFIKPRGYFINDKGDKLIMFTPTNTKAEGQLVPVPNNWQPQPKKSFIGKVLKWLRLTR